VQYVLLIYENEQLAKDMSEAERGKVMGGYMEFTKSVQASGQMKAGEPLEFTAKAKSVRTRGGKTTVTDGPFAETKEQLGGFYIVEAKTETEACEIAARIPAARTGTIEVRPIMKIPGM
jgi:hypothetical protein